MNSLLWWGFACAIWTVIGIAITALMAWRRPELFNDKGDFYSALAIVIIAIWPIFFISIVFYLAASLIQIVWRRQQPKTTDKNQKG